LKIAGIIAEYNPLHQGHLYHIRKTKEIAQIDGIIAVISSNFVQRGEPALLDKAARAEMALACGVDLALELPAIASSCNAGIFADAAVDILASTGLVDLISFGAESGPEGKSALYAMADILNEEPPDFRELLKKFLKRGCSYVQSRSLALEALTPGALETLRRPNNNLALAYVKRIVERRYPLDAFPVERRGAGFHDLDGSPDAPASAAALRELVSSGEEEAAYRLMPGPSADILRKCVELGCVARDWDRIWRAVKQAILRSAARELADIAEMREGLENKILSCAYTADSFSSFADALTSRRYPRGRIQRYCMHILLNLRREQCRNFQKNGPSYIRVLGANKKGREMLARMRKTATLPVICGRAGKQSDYARDTLFFERRSSEIWETLTDTSRPLPDRPRVPLMLDQA
jgi:predicted nucleotidyltransferase